MSQMSSVEKCVVCGEKSLLSWDPYHFWLAPTSVEQLPFCRECLNEAFFGIGRSNSSRKEIVSYLQKLASILGYSPSEVMHTREIELLTDIERDELVRTLLKKPSTARIAKLFSSWDGALIKANLSTVSARRARNSLKVRVEEEILKWWTTEHDSLVFRAISDYNWFWGQNIRIDLAAISPPYVKQDMLCGKYHDFIGERSIRTKMISEVRIPKVRTCLTCKTSFAENTVEFDFYKALGGVEGLNFCNPCLTEAFCSQGKHTTSKDKILEFLKKLSSTIRQVPSTPSNRAYTKVHPLRYLGGLNADERSNLVKSLKSKPTRKSVESLFGSWFHALAAADVIPDGVQKTHRGVRCIAEDGHVCFSLGEKTIDDLLYRNSIPHTREPQYPGDRRFRGDFYANGTFVEYFGLLGNPEYDQKITLKRELCKAHGIPLLELYPKDLMNYEKLEAKLVKSLSSAFTGSTTSRESVHS